MAAGIPGSKVEEFFETSLGARYVDVWVPDSGLAIEVKSGAVSLTTSIGNQIKKDAELLANDPLVDEVQWVFKPSPVTGLSGPNQSVKNALRDAGITLVVKP